MSDRGVGAVNSAQVGGVAWAARDHAAMGLPVSFDLPVDGHLDALADLAAGAAYLEWRRYQHVAALHTDLVLAEEDRDERAVDAFAQCAARIATALSVSQYVAERILDNAVALRDRLPRVFECLRDGVVSPSYIRTIVSRTELIHGRSYQGLVDADIAAALRKPGSWSTGRVRDLCDQMVYRRDPDAVRERRDDALKGRCFFTEAGLDGMATVGATMSAEQAAIVARVVERLAAQVCRHDSRTKTARASDALFALVEHAPFGCDCARPDCAFTVVDADEVAANAARIVIHVVTDTTTLTGPVPAAANDTTAGTNTAAEVAPPAAQSLTRDVDTTATAAVGVSADQVVVEEQSADSVAAETISTDEAAVEGVPAEAATDEDAVEAAAVEAPDVEPELVDGVGYIAGLGIVSGAHVRDLAADPATLIRPLGDGTDTPLPATQPADPYRPSAALNTYIRARDQYCTWPGCTRPAWDGDLDHITEYDHHNPERGGQTTATGLGAKCRFHHLLKTFGDFVDDQYPDPDHPGRIIRTFTIPEGRTVLGPAYTGHDTHPGLDMIVFGDPPGAGKKKPSTSGESEPTRPAPRTEQKHARRRQERNRNRLRNNLNGVAPPKAEDTPPPF
ncbi:HNH endonuclease signature motif containing protein [Rhodococcoides corynebacterioides]|uniref:HNH endonuclease signature motif containing protein n=1 Tax=Rhodococcoides corynebacterioides TaxID=53972 RepID=UPI0009332A36|nr:HNH endonuclease signature motif containing protein [Rhodococcus corynebacterioides]